MPAEYWNDNLPRKILGCQTPAGMFEIEFLKTAQGVYSLSEYNSSSLRTPA
ncbi:MAG: hypothetical protein LBU32_20980 [Clostridiales bacterium]|nr:hypothetical protein [Clostridiales bacterium]